jgi:serine protease Do
MGRFSLPAFILFLVLGLSILLTSCGASTTTPQAISSGDREPIPGQQQADALETADFSDVISAIRPSVVSIDIEAVTYDIFNQPRTVEGAGTGWVYDSQGYIVTNNHVIEGADGVTITLEDGRSFTADDIMADPLTDLAVVKITASDLTAAPTGVSADLQIGDWVSAIGNSLGMGISATVGVVSALDVSLQESSGQPLSGLVQTDAAINPGNSGGPLVNAAGEVVGITSIKIAEVGVEGTGYAISIDAALPIITTLIDQGFITRPYMGINAVTMTPAIAARYDLAVDTGALLVNIASGGPAEAAGLETGDIIVAVDDQDITGVGDLLTAINSHDIGDEIQVTYWRGEAQDEVGVTLAQSPTAGQ